MMLLWRHIWRADDIIGVCTTHLSWRRWWVASIIFWQNVFTKSSSECQRPNNRRRYGKRSQRLLPVVRKQGEEHEDTRLVHFKLERIFRKQIIYFTTSREKRQWRWTCSFQRTSDRCVCVFLKIYAIWFHEMYSAGRCRTGLFYFRKFKFLNTHTVSFDATRKHGERCVIFFCDGWNVNTHDLYRSWGMRIWSAMVSRSWKAQLRTRKTACNKFGAAWRTSLAKWNVRFMMWATAIQPPSGSDAFIHLTRV